MPFCALKEEKGMVVKMKITTIETLIDKQKIAYIASVDSEGYPNLKAMLAPRKHEGIKTFWFTTNTSSMRVGQYRENPKAAIYFCDNRFFRGVMLTGTMEVLEDTETKRSIWHEGDEMYYPEGVTDPDYCVLKFTAAHVRTYGNFRSDSFDIEV
jgi:general stress protein 26